jgi:DNA-binding LytR/AlgR family response regulator
MLLSAIPDVTIVGEAEDGEEAVGLIARLNPDLVPLDIQMPGRSGFEVAAALPAPRPKIIFCTAFDQYAIEAWRRWRILPVGPIRATT